jgi:alanine racemase
VRTRIDTGANATGIRGARSEPPQDRPTWAEIDLEAIRDNTRALKRHATASRLMAVVKADGYGHGIVPSARAALAGGADWLAVALVEEGRVLREAGIDAPVLVMTEPPDAAAPAMIAARLTPAVYTPAFVAALDRAAAASGQAAPVDVHLKLDTGMRRVGVPPADWEDALRRVRDTPGVRLQGLWSHYAVADEPDHPFIGRQTVEFARGLDMARRLGVEPSFAHLANSAGTLHLPESHHDMVRPGLAVYGLEPAPGLAEGVGLRPALAWYSSLSLVKRLAAGEAVSYGLTWAPEQDTRLGTVPAGYADGVVRGLGNVGEVVVGGRRVPIAGRVCMDQFCVDLGDGDAAAGDEVCLIGRQGAGRVTADDWAGWLHTINYEIVCGVGARVPRVYLGDS